MLICREGRRVRGAVAEQIIQAILDKLSDNVRPGGAHAVLCRCCQPGEWQVIRRKSLWHLCPFQGDGLGQGRKGDAQDSPPGTCSGLPSSRTKNPPSAGMLSAVFQTCFICQIGFLTGFWGL
jgi:hypothetical protein